MFDIIVRLYEASKALLAAGGIINTILAAGLMLVAGGYAAYVLTIPFHVAEIARNTARIADGFRNFKFYTINGGKDEQ